MCAALAGGRSFQRRRAQMWPPPSPWTGIEDLREKREEVNRSIAAEEEEKAKIQADLRILTGVRGPRDPARPTSLRAR